jgi:hypothetical protein
MPSVSVFHVTVILIFLLQLAFQLLLLLVSVIQLLAGCTD